MLEMALANVALKRTEATNTNGEHEISNKILFSY